MTLIKSKPILLLALCMVLSTTLHAQTDPEPAPDPITVTLPDTLDVNVLNLPEFNFPDIDIPDIGPALKTIEEELGKGNTDIKRELTTANETLQAILKSLGTDDDITRYELANAIINYEALARIKEFQLNMDLLYELAPGAMFAVVTAENIENTQIVAWLDTTARAVLLRNAKQVNPELNLDLVFKDEVKDVLAAFKSGTITEDELNANLKASIVKAAESSLGVYEKAKDFFLKGDLDALNTFNPGALFTSFNNMKLDNAIAMIGLITDPMPILDDEIGEKLKKIAQGENVALTKEQKEKLATKVLEGVLVSMSTYALADVAARRMEEKSMIKNFKTHSTERFADVNWHNEIAKASEAALLRELVQMMAYQQWTNYQSYRLQEQQVALLATMNATMARLASVMDMVRREYQNALTQAQTQLDQSAIEEQINQQLNENIDFSDSINTITGDN